MISKDEIISVAGETGLTPSVVEKDYVLGWLLGAINGNSALSTSWVFKGGTCLKKCYFETYRFSEDLDFTLKDQGHLDKNFLQTQFESISDWVYEETGIEIPPGLFKFDIYTNQRDNLSCEARIYYKSYFSSGRRDYPKIKLDLTADEVLVSQPTRQKVRHSYTDLPADGIFVECYAYPEIFAEKVRALSERGRPRDLYDVINLFRNDKLPDRQMVQNVLKEKCAFKGIKIPTFNDISQFKEELIQNWEGMLAHQLPSLPAFEIFWNGLPEFFAWLEGLQKPTPPPLTAITQSGQPYNPPYGRLGLKALNGSSLETIRFAASNHLCVDLDYTDKKGLRSNRIIEPYSFRKSQDGNISLHAIRAEDGQSRSYRIEQINDVSITNRQFTPQYPIELSTISSDSWAVPRREPTTRLGTTSTPRLRRKRSSSKGYGSGPAYIYRCPHCDKTFRRKKRNSKLRPHKAKDGWDCGGRTGYYEDTIY